MHAAVFYLPSQTCTWRILWKFEDDWSDFFSVISIFVTILHADFSRQVLNIWKFVTNWVVEQIANNKPQIIYLQWQFLQTPISEFYNFWFMILKIHFFCRKTISNAKFWTSQNVECMWENKESTIHLEIKKNMFLFLAIL